MLISWLYYIVDTLDVIVHRRRQKRLQTVMRKLYPEAKDRAIALIAEGTSLIEISATGSGSTLKRILILPNNESEEGGYDVLVEHMSDEYEFEYDEEDEDETNV